MPAHPPHSSHSDSHRQTQTSSCTVRSFSWLKLIFSFIDSGSCISRLVIWLSYIHIHRFRFMHIPLNHMTRVIFISTTRSTTLSLFDIRRAQWPHSISIIWTHSRRHNWRDCKFPFSSRRTAMVIGDPSNPSGVGQPRDGCWILLLWAQNMLLQWKRT